MSDDELLESPIIIVGAPRSGTTLLGQTLARHGQLAYANEPRLVWRFGNDGRSDALRPEHATPEVRAHIRGAFAGLVRSEGRRRLLEKTPANALRLDFVDAVLPGCRFVHMLRHGVDSVLGIQAYWSSSTGRARPVDLRRRLREIRPRQLPYYAREAARRLLPGLPGLGRNVWGPRLPGIESLLSELDALEISCLQWRACVEAACQAGRRLPADRYLELRLEDVSEASVRRVLEFCGLEDDPAVWEEFHRRFEPGLSGGRSAAADPEEVARIRRWIEPTMRWLGQE